MPLRECPETIRRAVRRYDPALDIRWDDRECRWYLCNGERALFALDHEDGKPMLNIDGCTDEILRIIRNSDTHHVFGEVRRSIRGARRRLRESRRQATEEIHQAASGEARHIARFMRTGPAPRDGKLFQGVWKR